MVNDDKSALSVLFGEPETVFSNADASQTFSSFPCLQEVQPACFVRTVRHGDPLNPATPVSMLNQKFTFCMDIPLVRQGPWSPESNARCPDCAASGLEMYMLVPGFSVYLQSFPP